jgi:hypothetical protein
MQQTKQFAPESDVLAAPGEVGCLLVDLAAFALALLGGPWVRIIAWEWAAQTLLSGGHGPGSPDYWRPDILVGIE